MVRHPLLKSERAAVRKLNAIYYDTPNLDLWRHGAVLRVRREGGRWIQAVKWGRATQAGLHQGNELEVEVSGPSPDVSKINRELDGLFTADGVVEALQPIFETRVTRSSRMLHLAGDVIVEASLDRGEIKSGDRAEPLSELELELKQGSASALFSLASNLIEHAPLALENRSKAYRGYALYREELRVPLKATTPPLDAAMSVNDAFKAIAWSTLRHLQGNEEGVLRSDDPEFLHQMRVALRRFRSALSAFSPVVPDAARALLAEDLKWLGGVLGPARDFDVFMLETLPPIRQAFEEHKAMGEIEREGARLRAATALETRRELRSQRYQRAVLGIATWLASEAWRSETASERVPLLEASIAAYAETELERRYEKVRKRGRKLTTLSASDLHRLRIAIKKLRYSVEFFGNLYKARHSGRLRSRLTLLQDTLGTINDAATMPHLLEKIFPGTRAPALAEARGLIQGWSAGRADALRGELKRSWKRFRRSDIFW